MTVELEKAIDLSRDLIRYPSVTADRETNNQILEFAKSILPEFRVETFEKNGMRSLLFYNSDHRPERFRVLLNAHLDVVSGNPEQYNPYIKDGRLYGRGAIDMKGAAAMEILVFKHLAKSLPYDIALEVVTDEEVGGFGGTGYQVEQGVRTDLVITGESTDLDINNERKGVLVVRMNVDTNKPAHAAYLWDGENALVALNESLGKLLKKYPIPKQEVFATTVNLAKEGTPNEEHNKVPSVAWALLDFRFEPTDPPEKLLKYLHRIAPKNAQHDIEIVAQGVPSFTPPDHPDVVALKQAIENRIGREVKTIKKHGSSDTRHHIAVGAAGVDFGPIGDDLHGDNEYLDIKSLGDFGNALTDFLLAIR